MRPEPSRSSQPLCGPNLALVHSKVMRNFMPERLLHQPFQMLAVTSHPLVGTLKYRDSVGQMKRLKNTAVRQRSTFIQSEKRAPNRVLRRPSAIPKVFHQAH
jgi:hypothetical protein